MASGLTYIPGSTRISLNNPAGAGAAASDPVLTGTNILTWTPTQIPALSQLDSASNVSPAIPENITFIFQVRRTTGLTQESLVTAIRNMEARSSYTLSCGGPTQNTTSNIVELPIRQPIPQTTKLGRNVDAAQAGYTPVVYGHVDDDVICNTAVSRRFLRQYS